MDARHKHENTEPKSREYLSAARLKNIAQVTKVQTADRPHTPNKQKIISVEVRCKHETIWPQS